MHNIYHVFNDGIAVARAWCSRRGEKDHHYWLSSISVMESHRGRGFGSQLLDLVCEEADLHSIDLSLHAYPSKTSPLRLDDLLAWYERRGFVRSPGSNSMTRKSKTPKVPQVTLSDLSAIWSGGRP